MVQRNIAPPSLPGLLHIVAEFEDSTFDRIATEISKPTSTTLTDEQFVRLSRETNVDEDDLRLFISFVTFLYEQTEGIEAGQLEDALLQFFEDAVGDDLQSKVQFLAKNISSLLSYREAFDAAEKRLRLTRGFLPFVLSSSSFVDLRPDFERGEDGKVRRVVSDPVKIVQLLIKTNSKRESESEITLQLDLPAVKQLQETLAEIVDKIEILEEWR